MLDAGAWAATCRARSYTITATVCPDVTATVDATERPTRLTPALVAQRTRPRTVFVPTRAMTVRAVVMSSCRPVTREPIRLWRSETYWYTPKPASSTARSTT